mmetsp:Transcript_45078/g.111747  ORF Transcript_45078/g.111747 Transcript_45078/m.111747 type:complete len:299 (+) Transcript_45078:77-973(+)
MEPVFGGGVPPGRQVARYAQQGGRAPLCRFFQLGRCDNERCSFRHESAPPSSAFSQADSQRQVARPSAQLAAASVSLDERVPSPKRVKPDPSGTAAAPRNRASMAPFVAIAGLDVASAAMAHIAGRQVLQPGTSARPNGSESGPCKFFCRTGACDRGDGCKYAHDADKIALCRAFLAGRCPASEGAARGRRVPGPGVCLLSHELTPERTPVCTYFLRGLCTDDACVYAHVAVSRSAPPCADFACGYCARGSGCQDQHLLACDEWASTGQCTRDDCPLRHTHRTGAPKKRAVGPTAETL